MAFPFLLEASLENYCEQQEASGLPENAAATALKNLSPAQQADWNTILQCCFDSTTGAFLLPADDPAHSIYQAIITLLQQQNLAIGKLVKLLFDTVYFNGKILGTLAPRLTAQNYLLAISIIQLAKTTTDYFQPWLFDALALLIDELPNYFYEPSQLAQGELSKHVAAKHVELQYFLKIASVLGRNNLLTYTNFLQLVTHSLIKLMLDLEEDSLFRLCNIDYPVLMNDMGEIIPSQTHVRARQGLSNNQALFDVLMLAKTGTEFSLMLYALDQRMLGPIQLANIFDSHNSAPLVQNYKRHVNPQQLASVRQQIAKVTGKQPPNSDLLQTTEYDGFFYSEIHHLVTKFFITLTYIRKVGLTPAALRPYFAHQNFYLLTKVLFQLMVAVNNFMTLNPEFVVPDELIELVLQHSNLNLVTAAFTSANQAKFFQEVIGNNQILLELALQELLLSRSATNLLEAWQLLKVHGLFDKTTLRQVSRLPIECHSTMQVLRKLSTIPGWAESAVFPVFCQLFSNPGMDRNLVANLINQLDETLVSYNASYEISLLTIENFLALENVLQVDGNLVLLSRLLTHLFETNQLSSDTFKWSLYLIEIMHTVLMDQLTTPNSVAEFTAIIALQSRMKRDGTQIVWDEPAFIEQIRSELFAKCKGDDKNFSRQQEVQALRLINFFRGSTLTINEASFNYRLQQSHGLLRFCFAHGAQQSTLFGRRSSTDLQKAHDQQWGLVPWQPLAAYLPKRSIWLVRSP